MKIFRITSLIVLVFGLLILTGCSGNRASGPSDVPGRPTPASGEQINPEKPLPKATPVPPPSKKVDVSSPETALKSAFAALEANDMNTYIDLLDPAIRSQPNNPALVGNILGALTGIKIETGTLAFRNMQYSVLEQYGEFVFVRVAGAVRVLSLGSEQVLDDVMVMHRIDNRWFLSQESVFENSPEAEMKRQVVATATAVAEATRIAYEQEMQVQDARAAVQEEDWYVAAVELQNVLDFSPDNKIAADLLASIAPHVPGALVDGPLYRPFTGTEWLVLPHWQGGTFMQISPDAQRVLFTNEDESTPKAYALDLATGDISDLGVAASCGIYSRSYIGCWDPSATWTENGAWNSAEAVKYEPIEVRTQECGLGESGWYWAGDGLMAVTRAPHLLLWNVASGKCETIELPAITSESTAWPSPDRKTIWVEDSGRLFKMQSDGTSLMKVADLPSDNLWSSTLLPVRNGSVIYLGGYLISTKTGRLVPVFKHAVAGEERTLTEHLSWIDQLPPVGGTSAAIGETFVVEAIPAQGTQGTTFKVNVRGGLPGMKLVCHITPPTAYGRQSWRIALDPNGQFVGPDENGACGWKTDLGSESGMYHVEIHKLPEGADGWYGTIIGQADFVVQ